MNKIELTILTPSYNRAHTLHRVFDSLKSQTLQNFKWLIIDDGSTDNTKEIVEKFQKENVFPIEYHYKENENKFITIFNGVHLVNTDYLCFADSDDSFPNNSIEILYNEISKFPKDGKIMGVVGLSTTKEGEIIGDKFPNPPLDSNIFDMRYKYKIKGDKWGIGITKPYKKLNIDFDYYKGKGFIPEVTGIYLFDKLGYKTRFINEVTRYYLTDEEDNISLNNSFFFEKNSFGLAESYRTFMNCYSNKFFQYPFIVLRNFVGYILFGIKDKRNLKQLISGINSFSFKILTIILYPFIWINKDYKVK